MKFPEDIKNRVATAATRIGIPLLCFGLGVILTIAYNSVILPLYKTTSVAAPPCSTSGNPSVEMTVASVTIKPGDPESKTEVTVDSSWTPTLPLTLKERFIQQEKELSALPRCYPVRTLVKLSEELGYWDNLLDREYVPEDILVDRCPYNRGQYPKGGRGLPTKTTNTTVVVRYVDNGKFVYAEKEVEKHLECSWR